MILLLKAVVLRVHRSGQNDNWIIKLIPHLCFICFRPKTSQFSFSFFPAYSPFLHTGVEVGGGGGGGDGETVSLSHTRE